MRLVQPDLVLEAVSVDELSLQATGSLTQAEAKGGNLHGFQVDVSAVGGRGQRVQQSQGGRLQEAHIQALEEAPQGHLCRGENVQGRAGCWQAR